MAVSRSRSTTPPRPVFQVASACGSGPAQPTGASPCSCARPSIRPERRSSDSEPWVADAPVPICAGPSRSTPADRVAGRSSAPAARGARSRWPASVSRTCRRSGGLVSESSCAAVRASASGARRGRPSPRSRTWPPPARPATSALTVSPAAAASTSPSAVPVRPDAGASRASDTPARLIRPLRLASPPCRRRASRPPARPPRNDAVPSTSSNASAVQRNWAEASAADQPPPRSIARAVSATWALKGGGGTAPNRLAGHSPPGSGAWSGPSARAASPGSASRSSANAPSPRSVPPSSVRRPVTSVPAKRPVMSVNASRWPLQAARAASLAGNRLIRSGPGNARSCISGAMSAASSVTLPETSGSVAATPSRPSPVSVVPAASAVSFSAAPLPKRPSRSTTSRPRPKPGSGTTSSPNCDSNVTPSVDSTRAVPVTRSVPWVPPMRALAAMREGPDVPSSDSRVSPASPGPRSATSRRRSGPSAAARSATRPGSRPGTTLPSNSASASTRLASTVASSRPPAGPTRPLAFMEAPPRSVTSSVSMTRPAAPALSRRPTRPAPTAGPFACPTLTLRASSVSARSSPWAAPVTVDRSGTCDTDSPSDTSCASNRPRIAASGGV